MRAVPKTKIGSIILRTGWWILTSLSILLFIYTIPNYYQELKNICIKLPCLAMQLNTGRAILLELSGFSILTYFNLIIAIQATLYLINLLIGVFLFARKSQDWMVGLISLMLITSIHADIYRALPFSNNSIQTLAIVLSFINTSLLVIFFYVFPTGSFRPVWTAGMAFTWIIAILANTMTPIPGFNPQTRPNLIIVLFLVGLIVSSLWVLLYRYRTIFDPIQRKQTRWVVFSVSVVWGGEIIMELSRALLPIIDQNALVLVFWNIIVLVLPVVIPISLLLAILRTALLDIDIILRRTLVYGAVTLTLSLIYIVSVTLLQMIFELFTGQQSQLVAIISTLVIAALFIPLRIRIQKNIDRIFFRRQYNSETAIQEFNLSVREDLDLEEISTSLIAIVESNLQPEFYSLWLTSVNDQLDSKSEDILR